MTQYLMVACSSLRNEITAIMKNTPMHYPVFYIPEELHLLPEKLNTYLNDFIARLENVDYLILPMGRCGNGTIGINSHKTTLVLPKCEDCISLLLSEDLLTNVQRPQYTYFFIDSWLDCKHSFLGEYEFSVEKYGKRRADSIIRMMYAHYKHFSYIDTGNGNFIECSERIKHLADLANVSIERLLAPSGVLKKMINLNFDEDFILVPPGETVTESMFETK